jgi:hypothetical protein
MRKAVEAGTALAIGIAAAFGVVLAARRRYAASPDRWRLEIVPAAQVRVE